MDLALRLNMQKIYALLSMLTLGLSSSTFAAYVDDIDALNPTHYWTFDNTLNDRGLGITTNGTFEDGAVYGGAITADSTNAIDVGTGQVTVGNTTDTNDGNDRYQTRTFSTWFQADDLSSPTVIWEEGAQVNNFAINVGVARNVQVQAADDNEYYLTIFADQLIEQSKPYHVAYTWERGTTTGGAGTRLRMWLNGVEQGTSYTTTDPSTAAFPSHTGDINFGNSPDSLKFYNDDALSYIDRDKSLAHFAIWNDVLLTETQIQTLFENGAAPTTSTLTLNDVMADTSIALHEISALGGTLVSETTSTVRDPGGDVILNYPVTTFVPTRLRLIKYGDTTYESDLTLDRFPTSAPFFLMSDSNISEASASVVRAYTQIETLDKLYDRSRAYDEDTPGNGFDLISANGTVLDLGAYDLVIDDGAGAAFDVNTGTEVITINAANLAEGSKFDRVKTTGTITFGGTATIGTAILEDSTGTSGQISLTGVSAANVLVYDDADPSDTTISYQTGVTGTIAVPFTATSSTDYQIVVRRQGFSEVNFSIDPSSGGIFEFPVNQTESLTIEGASVYQGTGNATKITMDYPSLRMNVGDFIIPAQELYDTIQDEEVTETAMKFPRISNYDGADRVLLLNAYQFRNRDGGAAVPGISAFVFAEIGAVLDNANGSVQFLSNPSATAETQQQIVDMLEAIQGSSWNDTNTDAFNEDTINLTNIAGTGFDTATDSLSALITEMLNRGIADVNTIKDLLE